MVRVLIVDDEPLARSRLCRMLARMPGVEIAGEAADGREALEAVARLAPDIVFLDIEMPEIDGLQVAEACAPAAVVFVTAHRTFAPEAFDLDACDYLVKPVSPERLQRALDKAQARREREPTPMQDRSRLAVCDRNVVRFVDVRQVDCFRALDKYTAFLFEGRELYVRESLSTLVPRLVPFGFVRVHRAALIRREAVRSMEWDGAAWELLLDGGERIAVSRRSATEVRRALSG